MKSILSFLQQGMPPYTAVLTTEIISNNTRNATFYDIAHARDEGGYCFYNDFSFCGSSICLQFTNRDTFFRGRANISIPENVDGTACMLLNFIM